MNRRLNRIKPKDSGPIISKFQHHREVNRIKRLAYQACACAVVLGCFSCASTYYAIKGHKEIASLKESLAVEQELTTNLMGKVTYMRTADVTITGYHPDSRGINSDSNPKMTSTMTPPKAGYTAAISTELVERGWLGKEIYISGYGVVLANDRLNPSIKGLQIDLCKGSKKAALKVGVHKGVHATVINRTEMKDKMEEN